MIDTRPNGTENLQVRKAVPAIDTGQVEIGDPGTAMKAKKLLKEARGDPDLVQEGDLIRDRGEIVITLSTPGDHDRAPIRDLRDHGRSLSLDTSLRVIKEQDLDPGLDRDVPDQEVPTEEDRALDEDPARAVESPTTVADQGPLAVGGVRGHTDIESSWNFRLYFFTNFYNMS